MSALCHSCRTLSTAFYTDDYGRDYCQPCAQELPTPPIVSILAFLAFTIPFAVGDRVECRTAGALYDGIGVIDEVSMELEKFGTPVYPSFHVVIEEKAYPEAPDALWYHEGCLTKVAA